VDSFQHLSLGCSGQVVSTSASDRWTDFVSEMILNVLTGMLNSTHSLTLFHLLLRWH